MPTGSCTGIGVHEHLEWETLCTLYRWNIHWKDEETHYCGAMRTQQKENKMLSPELTAQWQIPSSSLPKGIGTEVNPWQTEQFKIISISTSHVVDSKCPLPFPTRIFTHKKVGESWDMVTDKVHQPFPGPHGKKHTWAQEGTLLSGI
jgi:hypothetical protein